MSLLGAGGVQSQAAQRQTLARLGVDARIEILGTRLNIG